MGSKPVHESAATGTDGEQWFSEGFTLTIYICARITECQWVRKNSTCVCAHALSTTHGHLKERMRSVLIQ